MQVGCRGRMGLGCGGSKGAGLGCRGVGGAGWVCRAQGVEVQGA